MANNRLMIEEKMDLLIDEFKELNAYNKKKEEDDIDSKFDETVKTYNSLMRNYFVHHGAEQASPEQLTALCEEWYKFTRTGWAGHTTFAQTSVTAVSTGTPGGDNVGLTCTPSTDTKANVDQYAGLPQFACVDVNYEVTSDGDILITAIDGITQNFERYNPEKYVGVMQMALYHYWHEENESYMHGLTDTMLHTYGNIEPLPESIKPDGTLRHFIVHSKYMSKTVNGKMTSCSGLIPTAYNISHNSLHILSKQNGTMYSGGTTCDDAFLKLMAYVKYKSLTLDGILQGCCNNNYQYTVSVSETGVKRVILSADQANNFSVGMSVLIGTNSSGTDRGIGSVYSISSNNGMLITSIMDVIIDNVQYKAVYVDSENTFDTTAGTTIVSTFHWKSGSCDNVLGNDGSPVSCTSGKYPAKLQGIEFMVGGYEVLADVIMNIEDDGNGNGCYQPYICRNASKQSTSITSDYIATGLKIPCPDSDNWYYIKKLGYAKGYFFPIEVGGSSSTYTRDAFYMNNKAARGTREVLAFGHLNSGTGFAGLSVLVGHVGLARAYWFFLARLSPNGTRGELA